MSRTLTCRWVLTGTLVAQSNVHIGTLGSGPSSLIHARNGRDELVIPGTSLAGVIRAAVDNPKLWGHSDTSQRADDGIASFVHVYDAVATKTNIPTETREHVSIDRIHGVAARGHLFTRETVPAGTCFEFQLAIDDNKLGEDTPARTLIDTITGLLRGPGIYIGGATTKGLGWMRLEKARLLRQDLSTRKGIIATLRSNGEKIPLPSIESEHLTAPPPDTVRITIPFQPRGSMMVQVSVDRDIISTLVSAVPLTTTRPDGVRLELPGASIKGVLRSHAERIMRTLAPELTTPKDFLGQMRAEGLGPVAALFGTAGGRDIDGSTIGRKAALTAKTCVTRTPLQGKLWDNISELVKKPKDGLWFSAAQHVAIDRWTGGSAEGLLFAILEPHMTTNDIWDPLTLDLDVRRYDTEQELYQALTLLILVLRDLCDGWIGFGHGTTRGMGAVLVDPDTVRFSCGLPCGLSCAAHTSAMAELDGLSLTKIFASEPLLSRLTAHWPPKPRHEGISQ